MPLYEYNCPKCDKKCNNPIEVLHSISELEKPSDETIKEITCFCTKKGTRMERCYVTPCSVVTPTSKLFMNASRKKRNKDHFKKEVLPTLGQDEKIHHTKKLGYKVDTKRMGLR